MKGSNKKNGCNNVLAEAATPFLQKKMFYLLNISKNFTHLTYFSRDQYFIPHQYNKFKKNQTRTSSFSCAPSYFLSRLTKNLNHLVFFDVRFSFFSTAYIFYFVLYRSASTSESNFVSKKIQLTFNQL